eukprot:gene8771-719_t
MKLHIDVWNNIIPYLDLSTLITFFQLSTNLYNLSNTIIHWKERIENEFPKSQINFETCTKIEDFIMLYKNLTPNLLTKWSILGTFQEGEDNTTYKYSINLKELTKYQFPNSLYHNIKLFSGETFDIPQGWLTGSKVYGCQIGNIISFYQDWKNLLTNTIAKVKDRKIINGTWSDTTNSRGYYTSIRIDILIKTNNIKNELLNSIEVIKNDDLTLCNRQLFNCLWKGSFLNQSDFEMKLKYRKSVHHVSFMGNCTFESNSYRVIGNFQSNWISFILVDFDEDDIFVAALGELINNGAGIQGVVYEKQSLKGDFRLSKK